MQTQTKTRKLLLTALTVTVVGSIVAFGTFSAFSSSTENPGNEFAAGSVAIDDNDLGTAIYNVSNQKPGDFKESCIKVTYTGSLASNVRLYIPEPEPLDRRVHGPRHHERHRRRSTTAAISRPTPSATPTCTPVSSATSPATTRTTTAASLTSRWPRPSGTPTTP